MASVSGGGQTVNSISEVVKKAASFPETASPTANGRLEHKQQQPNGVANGGLDVTAGTRDMLGDSVEGTDGEGASDEEEDEEDEDEDNMEGETDGDLEGDAPEDDEDEEDAGESDEDASSMSGTELLAASVKAADGRSEPSLKSTSDKGERGLKPVLKGRAETVQNSPSDEEFALSEDEEDEDGVDELEDDEDSFDEDSPKRLKIDEEDGEETLDESRRRSGRERKVPKKFEIEPPKPEHKNKNRNKSASASRLGLVDDNSDDEDYDVKGRKRKKKSSSFSIKDAAAALSNVSKKLKKSSSSSPLKVKKSSPPTAKPEPQYQKLTRKIKKRPATKVADSGDDSEVSDVEVVSRSFKRTVGQKRNGAGTVASSKSNRARERVKYEEERESHSSDVRSDIDESELILQKAADEDIDTIDFVLDHRMGKSCKT